MKKLSIGLFGLVLLVTLFASTVFGAPGLPVGSQDELRQYALGKVVMGYRDVVAESLVTLPDQPTWFQVFGNGAEDVLDKLLRTEITFGLVNVQDQVTGRVWLYDDQNNLLFFGMTSYKVGTIGKAGPTYNIWPQPAPLLKEVELAEILVVDEMGQTADRQWPRIKDGRVLFEYGWCGVPNAILSVRFRDGTVSVFRLENPEGQSPATIGEVAQWKIQGHHVINRGEKPFLTVSVLESWVLPTVLLRGIEEGDAITLDVVGIVTDDNGQPMVERPLEAVVTDPSGKVVSLPMYNDEPTGFDAWSAGDYRIRFSWPSFGQPGRVYLGPGGGKG